MIFERLRAPFSKSKSIKGNDAKSDAETERRGKPIFIDLGLVLEPSCPSKTEPRRSKLDAEVTSKLDRFLKGSWNAS